MTSTQIMKKSILLFIILSVTVVRAAVAQQNEKSGSDTMLMVHLKETEIIGTRLWKNETVRYHYNQMKYYITTILPYLNAATALYTEMDNHCKQQHMSRRERKAYVRTREEEMRVAFEDKIRALNVTQAKYLMQLISRQTGENVYEMLYEFKNPFTAIKWQAWAELNGFNLNRRYNPEEQNDMEHIMVSLGYPLPSFYHKDEEIAENK